MQVLVAQLCLTLWDPHSPPELFFPWKSPGKNSRVGYCSLFQVIFPTERLHPVILHCWQILHHLSQQRSLWSVLGFSREWKQIGDREWERERDNRGQRERDRDTILLWLTLSFFTDLVFYTSLRLVATLPQVSYLAPFPQHHLLSVGLCVIFWWLFNVSTFYYYYICYGDPPLIFDQWPLVLQLQRSEGTGNSEHFFTVKYF